jgi:hypothetical protein
MSGSANRASHTNPQKATKIPFVCSCFDGKYQVSAQNKIEKITKFNDIISLIGQNCASYVQHKASIEICLTCQDLQIEQAILINPV